MRKLFPKVAYIKKQMNERHFEEFYNKNSSDVYYKFTYHLEKQLEGIDLKGKNVLEVGCGKGFVSFWIALFGEARKVVALDESEGVGSEKGVLAFLEKSVKDFNIKLTLANSKIKMEKERLENIKVVKCDIMNNSFPNDSFDIIIANNALHHVVRTGKYILEDLTTKNKWINLFCELKRLLKPNGMIVLGEFSRKSIWRYIKLRYRQIDWELHPTLNEWLLIIKLAGFKEISFKYIVPYKLRHLRPLLSNSTSSFFISPIFNIYAKK